MSAFPTRSDMSGSPSNATAKAWLLAQFDALAQRLAAGTTGAGTASESELKTSRDSLGVPLPNWLDNPDGAIYQRSVASTANDAYMDDRWYALTQTGNITPSQVSNPEDGYDFALRLTQAQASAQRMGAAQILEGKDTRKLRGKTVTYGGRFKLSTSADIRLALLAWTSTEDSPTSDPVNDWTSSTYTAGNFFLGSNLTVVGVAEQAMTAGTAGTASVSGAVPSNANNLMAMYWTEGTVAQNVTLDRWGQRIVEASSLLDYIRRPHGEELRRCQRFYRILQHCFGDLAASSGVRYQPAFFPEMRIAPTAGSRTTLEADSNINSIAISDLTVRGGRIGITPTAANPVFFHSTWPLSADL